MENTVTSLPRHSASPTSGITVRHNRSPYPRWTSFVMLFILSLHGSLRGVHGNPSYEFAVPKPEFGETSPELNVTSFTGHTSRLPCTVRHLAGKQVSWIRLRDLTVLSSGRITFATDVRITVLPGTNGAKRIGRSVKVRTSRRAPPPTGDYLEVKARNMNHCTCPDVEISERLPDMANKFTPDSVRGGPLYGIEDEESSDTGREIRNKRMNLAHQGLAGGSGYSPQTYAWERNHGDSMEEPFSEKVHYSVLRENSRTANPHVNPNVRQDHYLYDVSNYPKKNTNEGISTKDHRVIENDDGHPVFRFNAGDKNEINSRKKSRVVRTNKIISSWDTDSSARHYSNDDKPSRLSYKTVGKDRLSDPDSGTEFDSASFNRILRKSTSKIRMQSRNSHYTFDDSVVTQIPISRVHVAGVTPETNNLENSPPRVTVTLMNSAGVGHSIQAEDMEDIPPNSPSSFSSSSSSLPQNYLEGVWEPEDFTLQIKYTEPGDAGTYVCQVNTEPKTAQKIHLTVIDMVAKILGPKELFVKEGTPVTLVCHVDHSASMPGFIFWYKGDRLVDYEASAGRVQVITRLEGRSELVLKEARQEDSSNYTCGPAGGQSASVLLSVIVDERPAAMQQGNGAASPQSMGSEHMLLVGVLAALVLLVSKCAMLGDEAEQFTYLELPASSSHAKNTHLARKWNRKVSFSRQKVFRVASKQNASQQRKGKCHRLFSSHNRPSNLRLLYDRRSLEERIEINREICDRKATKRKYYSLDSRFLLKYLN